MALFFRLEGCKLTQIQFYVVFLHFILQNLQILTYNSKSALGIISNCPAINFSDNFDLEKLKIGDGPLLVYLIKLPDMCGDAWIRDAGPLVKKDPLFNFGLLGCVDSRHRPFGEKKIPYDSLGSWAVGFQDTLHQVHSLNIATYCQGLVFLSQNLVFLLVVYQANRQCNNRCLFFFLPT